MIYCRVKNEDTDLDLKKTLLIKFQQQQCADKKNLKICPYIRIGYRIRRLCNGGGRLYKTGAHLYGSGLRFNDFSGTLLHLSCVPKEGWLEG